MEHIRESENWVWVEETPCKVWTLFDFLVNLCDGLTHWSHISLINPFQVHLSTSFFELGQCSQLWYRGLNILAQLRLPSCVTAVARTLYSSNTSAWVLCHPLKKWPMEQRPPTTDLQSEATLFQLTCKCENKLLLF